MIDRIEPAAPSVEGTDADSVDEGWPRKLAGRRVAQFLGGAALLSTTALLPAFETKIPPWKGD